ncbi:ankyrin [Aspergillus heteromorphus CBS 117.55]|uniref:Ankyrin n=1 Tax=Aspergillus heteromorphus CBS 117.55 TaxID=1448321 RepID=A0A317WP98_9EURO|nr:ankyrin [Aspergillus heteromorphus CBS 117.55]PWY88233.1 ankyrin [Aspergillus heteromorphus CBS 117.55]
MANYVEDMPLDQVLAKARVPPRQRYQSYGPGVGDIPMEVCLHVTACLGRSLDHLVKVEGTTFHRMMQADCQIAQPVLAGDKNANPAARDLLADFASTTKYPCLFEVEARYDLSMEDDDPNRVAKYISWGGYNANFAGSTLIPMLYYAVTHQKVKCVKFLLEQGADPNLKCAWRDGFALDYVLPLGVTDDNEAQVAIIEALVEWGGNMAYMNTFRTICALEREDLVFNVLANGTDIHNLKDSAGGTVLHMYASLPVFSLTTCTHILDQAVVDFVNRVDNNGQTALFRALDGDSVSHTKRQWLLHVGADPMIEDHFGRTAVDVAIAEGKTSAVTDLLHSPKTNIRLLNNRVKHHDPLVAAIMQENPEVITAVLWHEKLEVTERIRERALELMRVLGLPVERYAEAIRDAKVYLP